MEKLISETLKPGLQFINIIKPKDRVAIIHGHDNDSICSAAIIYKLLKNMHGIESDLLVSDLNSEVTESVLVGIRRMKSKHVIIVDIGSVGVTILTELRKTAEILIIDHHMPKGYVKISYVNPRIHDKEAYIPATYLCYKLYENYLDVKGILWIAGIGTLSDMGLKNCNDLFEAIKKGEKELIGDNENVDEKLFDNALLGKLAKIFDSGRSVDGIDGAVVALKALLKSGTYQDALSGKNAEAEKLLKFHIKSEKEFDRLVKDFEKRKKRVKNLVLYEVKSKLNMKSPLATFLSKLMKNEVLVIYQKSGKQIEVSFRRGLASKTDLAQLSARSVQGLPNSNGGGHIQAAGARFDRNYLSKFLRNLKSF